MSLARLLPVLLVALAAVVAMAPALDGRFIYDDQYYLIDNPTVRGESSPWTTPLGAPEQALWRPLTVATFAWQWQGPEAAGPLRAVNVGLHALTAVLLLLLARRLGLPGEAAVLAALLFAVHPVHAEAVAWVSGRAELLAAALVLASWLAWLRPGRGAAVVCAALFGAALLSKENALVAPLLFVAGDVLILRRPVARGRLAVLAAVAAAAWVARLAILPQALPAGAPFGEVPLGGRLAVAANILGKALASCVLPGAPRVFHPKAEFLGLQGAPWLVLAAAAVVVALCWRRQRAVAGALLLVPLALLTVLNLVPIGATFADRFLYLPSAFACLAAGALLATLARREQASGMGRGASVLLAGAALALALSACRDATRVFSSDLSLWAHEAAVAPDVAHVRYNHGYFLQEAGRDLALDRDLPGAADELAASLQLDPGHLYAAFAHQMLGNIALGAVGRGVPDLPLAARHYRQALERMPELLDSRINLATIAATAPAVVSPEEGLAALAPLSDARLGEEQARIVDALRAQLAAAGGGGDSPDSSTGTSPPAGS